MDGPVRRPARRAAVAKVATPQQPVTEAAELKSAEREIVPTVQGSKPRRLRMTRKRAVIAAVTIVVLAGAGFGIQAALAANKVVTRHVGATAPALKEEVDPTTLKGEGDGRINILLLGVGGDGHAGGQLSDTIMVASIDPRTKEVAMLSIPRDFYVKIGKYGSSKINAANAYGEMYDYEGGGGALAKETVSEILDVPIHYYVRVDFQAFAQGVDAVGGVDINVDKALYDPYYPLGQTGRVKVLNIPAGLQHFNGQQALEYSRSRKTTSDFDRAARQQKVIVALQQKTIQLSTLTNPVKVMNLVNTAGEDVQTDLQPKEIIKLATIVKDLKIDAAAQEVLDTSADNYLTQTTDSRGYIEYPKLGLYNYTDIRNFVHTLFADSYLKQEAAAVQILNGSTRPGVTAATTALLKGYGYNVIDTASADNSAYSQSQIVDYSNGEKPYTVRYLEKRFGATAIKKQRPAAEAGSTSPQPDVVVTIGANYNPTTSSGVTNK